MRILLLANHLNHGGITSYLLTLCRALASRGVEMFAASRGGELESEFTACGVRHVRLPLSTKCEVSPKVFLSYFLLRPFLRRERIDVIHANTRVTQVLAALLSRASGLPYVSTCHGYFKTRLSRRLFPCWGERVIAISDPVRDHLIRDFKLEASRVRVVYNGVDSGRFIPGSREEVLAEKKNLGLKEGLPVIGHIGRLSPVKGQKFLIEALARLRQEGRDAQCLIVGDGPEEGNLKTLIRERALGERVFLRPSVAQPAPALSVMDVFVMPSLEEGLGLSILEANAAGVPVVASRTGGIPAIVADRRTGLLVPVADTAALARAIADVLDHQALREAMVEAARAQVFERFSVEAMAAGTQSVYAEAAAGPLEGAGRRFVNEEKS